MRIANLGLGSLIWNPRDLPIYGGWQRGGLPAETSNSANALMGRSAQAGPVLAIEFWRISNNSRPMLNIDGRYDIEDSSRYILNPRRSLGKTFKLTRNIFNKWFLAGNCDKEADAKGKEYD